MASQLCQTCGASSKKTYSCVQCNNLAFCDVCWPQWVLHTPGAVGWNGKPHERADPDIVQQLRQIFEPPGTELDHERELQDDRETTWFGFHRDSSGQPIFQDFGRFATVVAEGAAENVDDRFPQFVSFIGETGAGKSSLIKLLIDRQGQSFPSPVISSNYDRVPTTGDVHLYADPSTVSTAIPLLFADCEGLNGGEAIPKALRGSTNSITDTENRPSPLRGPSSSTLSESERKVLHHSRHSTQRRISWANTALKRRREYAVAQLYPRILYTFSDVVVFVLRNPRAFESTVLIKLLEWGAASMDKSLNQPILPHALIVFNATEDVDELEWDVEQATKILFSEISGAVSREPGLQKLVRQWRERGKEISNTEELLKCYYTTVTVIRIPSKGAYMLMNTQATKLHSLIKDRCKESNLTKRKLRVLPNLDRLQVFLQAAFDHFTEDLDSPFDFVKEALKHSPAPRDFQGNIMSLALCMQRHVEASSDERNVESLFTEMSEMVASCIMLDSVRQDLMGTAPQLLQDTYSTPCAEALQTFSDMHVPCEFRAVASNRHKKMSKCCNVKVGHNLKGHQNAKGELIGPGAYQSSFDPALFSSKWETLILSHLTQLQDAAFELGRKLPGRTDKQIVAILHRERINKFYKAIGKVEKFISHTACYSCLRGLPECTLPCGHVLCVACVQAYGRKTSRTTLEITRCPLHVHEIMSTPPWIVTLKPLQASIRVLCLDGGGIKAIAELQVLAAIQNVLGAQLPIQSLFDLIMGTGTGGVIALALNQGWSINESLSRFKNFVEKAFTPRELCGVPVFERLANMYHKSMYKSQPLERALKQDFQDQPFFGAVVSATRAAARVAVVCATQLQHTPVVFANYNRPDPETPSEWPPLCVKVKAVLMRLDASYQFMRADDTAKEMKTWEVARAAFATSPFFKPFRKAETGVNYVDDGSADGCPAAVAESEIGLSWDSMCSPLPDIFLSIGAGLSSKDTEASLYRRLSHFSLEIARPSNTRHTKTVDNQELPGTTLHINGDKQSSDKGWDGFMRKLRRTSLTSADEDNHKYLRLNPVLNTCLPNFDDIKAMETFERDVDQVLQEQMPLLKETAHRLVASSFFFEKDHSLTKQRSAGFACTGSIGCRLASPSREIKGLGHFLKTCFRGGFEPHFLIEDDAAEVPPEKIYLGESMVNDMHLRGYFHIDPFTVPVSRELSTTRMSLVMQRGVYVSGAHALLISGFPRQLISSGRKHRAILQRHSILRNSRASVATTPLEKETDVWCSSKEKRNEHELIGSLGRAAELHGDEKLHPADSSPPSEMPC